MFRLISGAGACRPMRALLQAVAATSAVFVLAAAGAADAGVVMSTTTVLSANPNPVLWSTSTTFTAFVSSAATVTYGTVQFIVDGAYDGASIAVSDGFAPLTGVGGQHIGYNSVEAMYTGAGDFGPSTSNIVQELVEANTKTSLRSSASSISSNGQVTLTADVGGLTPLPGTPGGDVSFYDGGALLGVASLNGSAVASLQLNADALDHGANNITATYAGAGGFLQSMSRGVAVTVVPEPATWTMLIAGVAMIGFGLRRRRQAPALAA